MILFLHRFHVPDPTKTMAEIVGLAASILAILSVADSAVEMAKRMKRLSRSLGAAKKEIRNFSRDIDAFASVIGAAHYALKEHSKPEAEAPSKVLVFIQERKLLDQLVDQSERVIEHIEELRPSIKSLRSKISLITRFRWLMQRTDVMALGPKMECVKTSLNLVMTMVSYEAIMQVIGLQVNAQKISVAAEREGERLKRDMVRLLEQLVESPQRHQQGPFRHWDSPENTFVDVQQDIQEALVELGKSIVKHDKVPDVESSSTSSRTLRPHVVDHNAPVDNERRRADPVSSRGNVRHHQSPNREHIMGERAPISPPIQVSRHQNDDEEISDSETEESVTSMASEVPAARPDSDPGKDQALSLSNVDRNRLSQPQQEKDGDFIAVQKTSRRIYFNPAVTHEMISGYIAKTKGHGAHHVTAIIDLNLAENIISLALAVKLDLTIEVYDPEYDKESDWKWIRVGDGAESKSRGRVVLQWSQGAFLSHAPLKIHCWVYEDVEEDVLVFGRSFVGKRRHYWEETELEEG